MDAENQSAASDATEQPASQGVVEEQPKETAKSFAAQLLEGAADDGFDVGLVPPKVEDKPAEQPEAISAEPEPEAEQEEPEAESQPEGQDVQEPQGEKEEPKTTERKSIEDQIAEAEAKGEKPPWYLKRIVEERQKRERIAEDAEAARINLAKVKEENQQLQDQLQKASAPRPNPQAPLADIYDEASLAKIKDQYEEVKRFTELHAAATEDVLYGKNDKGEDIYLTPEQIAEMRYRSDRALREDIPQRRAFLAQRQQEIAKAVELYPEFKDDNNPMTQQAVSVLRQNPMLESVLGPQTVLWIGRALKGMELEQKRNENGSNGTKPVVPDATKRIAEAAKTKIAPATPKSRSFSERRSSADLVALKKNLAEKGDEEAADAYLDAVLSRGRARTQVT